MTIKVGNIVSHSGGLEWGSGKITEVTSNSVMIQFSDGKSRKIAASHFTILESAPPGSYSPPAEIQAETKTRAPRKKKTVQAG